MVTIARVHEGFIETHQPYVFDHFVDRDRELGYVRDQVRRIREQGFTTEPLINYWGVKGIGKTWILEHVRQLYAYRPDEFLVRPTFAVIHSFAGESVLHTLVQALAYAISTHISAHLFPDEHALLNAATTSGSPEPLVAVLNTLALRFVPVILIDNAEHVAPADWQDLGHRLIEPLVIDGRVLVVIAGRRQAPRWAHFDVRSKTFPAEQTLIRSFSKDAVFNQVSHANYSFGREVVDQFFPYTAGNPQLVDAIARHLRVWSEGDANNKVDHAWIQRHRTLLIEILGTSLDRLLDQTPQRLYAYLEAVAPLRFYRLEALRKMLANSGDGAYHADGYYHQILRELDQQTEVVWWERERRAYVTSDVVRQVMSRRQLLADREGYMQRHSMALGMYRGWVNTFPQASEEFIVEILFHLTCLYLAHSNVEQLQSEVDQQLDFANQYLNLERFHILQQQLDGDREIFDLAPIQIRERIIQRLGMFISAKEQN